ncbi:Protein of unknown function [Rhizobium sp. RU35A]|uniref:DUF1403 family protein n=1 Tax=Rhizobium sp. RU35A TaxID=1907414 RepID=UPI00095474FC|nr:DUF1403 family protein [Rhizobium sp. RU35A]SIQ89503.1 Protein of unknown function [Rhizobium sp. RU35A]
MSPAADVRPVPDPSFQLPGWAGRRVAVTSEAEAAFLAGAALLALDRVVRADYPWAGAWRQRLALRSAVSAVRLAGRREDEAALRDGWVLRRPADEPGPSGNLYAAWKRLASRPPTLNEANLRQVVSLLDLPWSDDLSGLPALCGRLRVETASAPSAMAQGMVRVSALGVPYELLGWWLADALLAEMMQWPAAVPLLMAERFSPRLRSEGSQRRLLPGEANFASALSLVLADAVRHALTLAGEMDRRATRLLAVAPKLRAKGAGDAIGLLLGEDAVSGSLTTPRLSRFASRRLFDRLLDLEAVRELSGRPNFRIFGI